MNATIESLFGPRSEEIDIPAFVRAAVELEAGSLDANVPSDAAECDVQDIRDSLFDTWNNPSISAYLSKDHDHSLTSLYSTTKSAKPKRKVLLPAPDSLPPHIATLQRDLDAIKLTSCKSVRHTPLTPSCSSSKGCRSILHRL
ncbi:hypothetical protein D9615_004584 [Tricholomella constricta]|uniref:Uncharacterized protein n=1 Tax=Tricholomella constricta TaxID=117010 RepID=A0A8H5M4N4_9AGAR|nr:hypothetical protein D9615_004584 [Tricholomella constricta]